MGAPEHDLAPVVASDPDESRSICAGHIYARGPSSWKLGCLRVTRTHLCFDFARPGEPARRILWSDVMGVRVLSTIAADFDTGCFDVAIAPGAISDCSDARTSDTAVGSPSVAQTLARFPGSATTLRFMTGDLSIAAHWVGEIDDAVAAAEEGSLDEWWKLTTARRPHPIVLHHASATSPLATSLADRSGEHEDFGAFAGGHSQH